MDTMYKVGIKENDHVYFNVIDSAAVKRMETNPLMTNARTILGSSDPVENMGEELEAGVENGSVFKGESIEELAKNAGIDADVLKRTVDSYNKMADAGEDTQFYKDAACLFAVKEAPFYAFRLIPSWYSALCGVKVNGNVQVIGEDGKPIGGLYAGGLDSGEFFKDNYNHGFFWGGLLRLFLLYWVFCR